MTITAHSGAFETEDNSMENIRKVLDENCEIMEVDVTFRPDDTPVIIHKSAPSEEEGILLEEVLTLVANHQNRDILLNLDLKSLNNLPQVDYLLEKNDLKGRAFFTGVFEEWVETVKKNSSLQYYLNASIEERDKDRKEAVIALAKKVKKLGAIGLNTHYSNVCPILIETFHREGLLVSVWTVNEPQLAREFLAMGVDNLTTRKPDMF